GDLAPPVVVRLAPREPELQLGPATAQVQPQRHDREALRLRLAQQLIDLLAMKEELAGPLGLVVVPVAGLPGRDVQADEPRFAVLDARVGVGQADLPGSDALDLGPGQHDAGLEGLLDRELVPRSSVEGDGAVLAHLGSPYRPS